MKNKKNSKSYPDKTTLKKYLNIYKEELYERVIPFWLKYSLDKQHGGYFTCLDEDGKVYDTKKYMWLHGRQSWLFSKLYNTVEQRAEWLKAAKLGVDFMKKHGITPEGRVYFSLTREGKPYHIQRKIFSECFYVMALSEYAKAVNDNKMLKEALDIFEKILKWSRDLTLIGRPKLSGIPPVSSFAIPMILLDLITCIMDTHKNINYKNIADKCVQEICLHVNKNIKAVLENVGTDGSLIDSPEGRLLNPGHAIEASWFLFHYNEEKQDKEIEKTALQIIDWSLEQGWDKKYGGIFNFLYYKNLPLLQLEWSMKLWWPHTEALYALLLAFINTKNIKYWNQFEKIFEWTFRHFPDKKHGEWYGYLDQQGNKTHTLKGSAYKGCFHIPRFLLYSIKLLEKEIE